MKTIFWGILLFVCAAAAVPPPCFTSGYDGPKVDAVGVSECEGRCLAGSQPPHYGYVMQVCKEPEVNAPCYIDRHCSCFVLPLRG
ncbi:hypothetical protein FHG87_012557 [Trinorchestia longiramus]|nr:hypothetical protein FHG87_012557 [Trinorchestia longiramus]